MTILTEEQLKNVRFLAIDLETEFVNEYDPSLSEDKVNDIVADFENRINEAGIPDDIRTNLLNRLFDENLFDVDALSSTYEYLYMVLDAHKFN